MTETPPHFERALDTPDAKIWRYTNLPKFVSLLTKRALFFASPSSFHDPYEGWMPRSHIEAMSGINQGFVDQYNGLRAEAAARYPGADTAPLNAGMDKALAGYAEHAKNSIMEACLKFGVNCWHKSEYESEAMWRAYPTDSLAIESTVGRLRDADRSGKSVHIDNVRYMDFDNDPIEKGHTAYLLVLKRKSFEHERELRATVLIGDGHTGAFLDYDIDLLITRIHVSPRASEIFRQATADVLKSLAPQLGAPLLASKLYEKPDYGIKLKLRPAEPTDSKAP